MKREHIESMFNALGDLVATMWEQYREQKEEKTDPIVKECEFAIKNYKVGQDVLVTDGDNRHFYKVDCLPYIDGAKRVVVSTTGGLFELDDISPISNLSFTFARPNL